MERLRDLTAAMMRDASTRTFARVALSLVRGGNSRAAAEFAAEQVHSGAWRDTPAVARQIRMASVGEVSGDLNDADWQAWSDASMRFIEAVYARSILGRLTAARRTGFNRGTIEFTAGAGAAWVQPGRAIPMRRSEFSRTALARKKVASMVVCSREFAATPNGEGNLMADMTKACADRLDRTFCSSSAASDAAPGGILLGAQQVASTGTSVAQIAADIRSLISEASGNGAELDGAVFLVRPETAALYRLLRVADDAGTLAGLPMLASTAVERTTLLCASHLLVAGGTAVELATSSGGLVEMSDAPVGDIITPTSASESPVALFGTDSIALRAVLPLNWELLGPQSSNASFACIYLTA